jgi:circadian clock protein KaiC
LRQIVTELEQKIVDIINKDSSPGDSRVPERHLPRYETGSDGLDRILGGGFISGSTYIIQGPPGAGKTILANQFCFRNAACGRSSLYISLLAESHHRMIEFMQGFDFFDAALISKRMSYISAFNSLQQGGLEGLLRLIKDEIRRQDATAVVLDGVFAARDIAESEHAYRRFIHELQGITNSQNCAMMLLTHQNHASTSPEYTMVDGWISLQDDLEGFVAYRTLQVCKQRGSNFLGGKHAFRIADAGLLVFPRLESTLNRVPGSDSGTGRLRSGIPGIDIMLAGGLPACSATLVMGPTGSGKTTMGLQFLTYATPQEPALLLSFYETPTRLSLKAKNIGIDFDAMIENGALEIMWYPPTEIIVDEVAHELLQRVQRKGIKRLFVDGVVALRDCLMPHARLPGLLNALNKRLRELGATTVYSSEIRQVFMPDKLPSDEISAMIDNLLMLSYSEQGDLLQRRISVLKLRDSTFDAHAHEIYIGEGGLTFGPDPRLWQGNHAST